MITLKFVDKDRQNYAFQYYAKVMSSLPSFCGMGMLHEFSVQSRTPMHDWPRYTLEEAAKAFLDKAFDADHYDGSFMTEGRFVAYDDNGRPRSLLMVDRVGGHLHSYLLRYLGGSFRGRRVIRLPQHRNRNSGNMVEEVILQQGEEDVA